MQLTARSNILHYTYVKAQLTVILLALFCTPVMDIHCLTRQQNTQPEDHTTALK
jgi:hypothetical protein